MVPRNAQQKDYLPCREYSLTTILIVRAFPAYDSLDTAPALDNNGRDLYEKTRALLLLELDSFPVFVREKSFSNSIRGRRRCVIAIFLVRPDAIIIAQYTWSLRRRLRLRRGVRPINDRALFDLPFQKRHFRNRSFKTMTNRRAAGIPAPQLTCLPDCQPGHLTDT